MKIAIGNDHVAVEMKERVAAYLFEMAEGGDERAADAIRRAVQMLETVWFPQSIYCRRRTFRADEMVYRSIDGLHPGEML